MGSAAVFGLFSLLESAGFLTKRSKMGLPETVIPPCSEA
jgi:hypothetical protein